MLVLRGNSQGQCRLTPGAAHFLFIYYLTSLASVVYYSMDIQRAIRDEVSEMGMHPFDINDGYCEDFAINVIDRMGGYRGDLCETVVEVETDGKIGCQELPGHVWIVCDAIYYDAEEPNGVANWRDLPFFVRVNRIQRYKSILTRNMQHEISNTE